MSAPLLLLSTHEVIFSNGTFLRDEQVLRFDFLLCLGASVPRGSLGYVNCALEILDDADKQKIRIDHLVTSTGSAGTQAGLVAGMRAAKSSVPILGIGTRAPKQKQEDKVTSLLSIGF